MDIDPGTRSRCRIVGGPDQAWGPPQIVLNIPLVPDVVARGHHIDAITKKLVGNVRSDTEACCGVLAIGDHNVNRLRRADVGHVVGNNSPARLSEYIANEKEFHCRAFRAGEPGSDTMRKFGGVNKTLYSCAGRSPGPC